MNLVTPKAAAKHELLFNNSASAAFLVFVLGFSQACIVLITTARHPIG
jgi:hypothetical protein